MKYGSEKITFELSLGRQRIQPMQKFLMKDAASRRSLMKPVNVLQRRE